LASTLAALALGTTLGLIAGYLGSWVDALIMRLVDLQLAFPSILLALVLLAFLGPGIGNIVVALITVQWAYYARTARGLALVESRREYILAAVALGLAPGRVILRHLLPNCLPPLIVVAALQIASAITLEATLSFLGLGVPVTQPSLGLLIANGFQYLLAGTYWISFFPGIALLATIMAINLVGDQLRDVLDPHMKSI
jgi:peptide/nickel transport system permease protein